MDEKYIQNLYSQLGGQSKFGSFDDFKDLMQNDANYRSKFHAAFGESTLGKYDDFESLVKKKTTPQQNIQEEQPTTESSSEESSSASSSQDEDGILTKIGKGTAAVAASAWKTVLEFDDNFYNAINSAIKSTDNVEKTNQLKTNMQQLEELKKSHSNIDDRAAMDPRTVLDVLKGITGFVINSTLSQKQKNALSAKLTSISNNIKADISDVEEYQKKNLPEGNIPIEITKNIVGMLPDLGAAYLLGNPAAAESRAAAWAAKSTEKSAPIIKKYAPKAAKVIEESIVAPFTKIMATKGAIKGAAETKEGENPYWNALIGGIEGTGEGMYMHGLGMGAGEVTKPVARFISKSGVNSAIATAIATPLANAGVFTTAKALRTAATEQRMITGEEAAMEAGTGVGFSLLHLKSQFDNQNEANHYYDNVLKDSPLNSFSRVINETKTNLDLAHNPDLTDADIQKLKEARDEIKKAIIKEPDMKKKEILGAEAIKIQNQLDAHEAINGIIANRDVLIDEINKNTEISDENKKRITDKISAIADTYDQSDFGVKKRELNTKITDANKELSDMSNAFTNTSSPSDRAFMQIKIDEKRKELEGYNNELNNLIKDKINQDAVQKQKSDESLLRTGEQKLGLQQVGKGNAELEATPEQEQIVSDERQKFQERLDNPEDQEELDDAKEYFDNPVAYYEKKAEFWKQTAEEDVDNKFGDKDTYEKVKQILEAHKAMEAPKATTESTEFDKKMQEERAKRGLDRLFPTEIDETTPEGKQLAKEKAEQDQKVKELEQELKSLDETKTAAEPTGVKPAEGTITIGAGGATGVSEGGTTGVSKGAEGTETATSGTDVVKTKKNEDNEHVVTLNGEEIGKIYYDPSQKTWNNANFSRVGEKPYTSKWIYGDVLGESKQQAIDEIVKRHNESALKKEEPKKEEEPQKVQYTKDNILNKFLNKLNELNPLKRNLIYDNLLVYGDKASLEFDRFGKENKNEIALRSIASLDKGKGIGSDVMKDITNAADDLGIKLTLDAKPFGRDGLTKQQLVDFYKKNGFRVDFEDAYGGDFKSEQELIDYALENESEAIPMSREPQTRREDVTMAEAPETKTSTIDVKGLTGYDNLMGDIDLLVPKYKEYVDRDYVKARDRYRLNKTEANKKALEKAKAEREEYKADVENGKKKAIESLENSNVYKSADGMQKDALMKEVVRKFGERQPSAPKPEQLFGNVAEAKKIMEELNFLFEDANKSKNYLKEKYDSLKKKYNEAEGSAKAKIKEKMDALKKEIDEYTTKNIGEAITFLRNNSDTYRNASKERREAMENYIKEKFLNSQKETLLPTELFKNISGKGKVNITEAKRWKDQWSAYYRGMKDRKDANKIFMKQLAESINDLAKKGSITMKQAASIIKRMANIDVVHDLAAIDKFTNYATKIFADAEYDSKIQKANDLKKQISKLSSDAKKDANLTTLGKEFAKIKPSMVEDIDAYNEMAAKIKESLVGSKNTIAEMVNIEKAMDYVNEQMDSQREQIQSQILESALKRFGEENVQGKTIEELKEMLKKKADEGDEKEMKEATKNMFDAYSDVIKKIFETGEDPLTGEKIDVTEEQKDLVKRFMGMDLDKLDQKQAAMAMDALANFIENGSTARMEAVVREYQGKEFAAEALAKGLKGSPIRFYGSDWLGRMLAEQVATLPMLEEMLFKGQSKARIFNKLSGLTELMNAKTFVKTKSNEINEKYAKDFYDRKANGKDFTDASNVAERGILASVKRTMAGTEAQQKAEFFRKKGLIEKSIDELRTGTEKERELANIYEEAYNKVLKDSESFDDVARKSDNNNIEAVDFWINEWSKIYDQLADISENVYNKILDKDISYTPDRFASLFERGEARELGNDESQFHHNNGTVYQKKTGVLEEINRSENLPQNSKTKQASMYLDLSFDKNNANALYDAMMDIHTAGVIRQIDAFFNSKEFREMVPRAEDRSLLFNSNNNGAVQDLVRAARGKEIVQSAEASNAIRRLNALSSIGTSTALGSAWNVLKQTVPVAANTLINTKGKLDLNFFMGPKADFLNKVGYGISTRGLESQTQIQSINKLVDLASKSKGSEALKYIEKANKFWLDMFLKHPDVYIAKASWISYYEKALEKQGIDPSTIDYSKYEVNKDAADYAESMVNRQQNVSDHDLSGKLFRSKNPITRFTTSILMPFASFRMNQFVRANNDLHILLSRDKAVTTEDRKAAGLSLSGYTVEMAVYKLLATGAGLAMGSLTNYLMGKDETDEEYQKRYDNLVRSQATGTVTDVISPLPVADILYAKGADKVIGMIQGLAGTEDKDKFKLMTSMKSDDMTRSWGTLGIGIKKAMNLAEIFNLANTGEFTDEYGRTKYISESDRNALQFVGAMSLAANLGLLPADANTVARNAISFAKRSSSTKEGGKEEAERQKQVVRSKKESERKSENTDEIEALNKMLDEETNPDKIEEINSKIDELSTPYYKTKEEREAHKKEVKAQKQEMDKLLQGYENKSDMKRYDPDLYEQTFGEGSKYYEEHKDEMEVKSEMSKKKKEIKDEDYNYVKPKKKKKNKDGSYKKSYYRSYIKY